MLTAAGKQPPDFPSTPRQLLSTFPIYCTFFSLLLLLLLLLSTQPRLPTSKGKASSKSSRKVPWFWRPRSVSLRFVQIFNCTRISKIRATETWSTCPGTDRLLLLVPGFPKTGPSGPGQVDQICLHRYRRHACPLRVTLNA